ncbi:hypothetical protein [Streptomyces sp. NRRL B-24484]|uniref:hypothetical protein n=1 Tax=Streptomyces sp. NRRL B-24484 TaxID=1463833 RepID=UPI0004BF122D|nr:hypothetical protein [Streptomyces sp. NRRL B-24484]
MRTPEPHTRASLTAAITGADHDRDQRGRRRLLARFAEQATTADLPALRNAIGTTRHHRGHPPTP